MTFQDLVKTIYQLQRTVAEQRLAISILESRLNAYADDSIRNSTLAAHHIRNLTQSLRELVPVVQGIIATMPRR